MRVLILNTACCWRKPNEPFTDLGRQLAERGVDVHHIIGGGPRCTFFGTLDDWTREKCDATRVRVLNDVETIGNPACDLLSFKSPEIRRRVDAWWEREKDLSPKERTYKGFRIRNLILGSLTRQLFRPLHPDPDMPGNEENSSEEDREIAQRLAYTAAWCIEVVEAALQEIQPDAILLFNGYFYLEWIFSAIAKRMGIRAVAHEASCFADRMFFDSFGQIGNRHKMSASHLSHLIDSDDFNEARQARLQDYLQDIYEGRVNNIPQAQRENLDELRDRLQIPIDKKVVLLIGQVSNDTVMIYDSGIFPTLLDYLRSVIETATNLPGVHLVIRLHPHEMNVNSNWTLGQIEQWDLPENVTVVHSLNANTYQLMELSDCGIALTSQAGLEMTAFGKPVVVCGNAFYKGKGFTYDVTHPLDLRVTLERALAEGGSLPPDKQHRLQVYLDHFIFDYLVPFDTDTYTFPEDSVTRILKELAPIASKQHAPRAKIAPTNIVANPCWEEDTEGWVSTGSEIERLPSEKGEDTSAYVLRCGTDTSAWSGVLYGCTKANQCDTKTLACDPGAWYSVSVDVKGLSEYEGVSLQMHIIGNHGANYATKKVKLSGEWQQLQAKITTAPDATHVGVQIVKYNSARPTAFLVRDLRVFARGQTRVSKGPYIAKGKADQFPRLLVLSEVPFGNHTGYGVTLTNLFRGWPKDRLALVYRMTEYEPDYSVCPQNLSLFDSSRDQELKDKHGKSRLVAGRSKLARGIIDTDSELHRVNVNRAKSWVKPFAPDVIFTSPVTYATTLFSMQMSRALSIPYVCHIMDDWLAHWEAGVRPPKADKREPKRQLKRNELTRRLFLGAAENMVISDLMADAYKARYGHEYSVLHNAVDLTRWDLGEKDYTRTGKTFRILYTGAIWWNIQMPTLKNFAHAVAELAEAGCDVCLDIYTHPSFSAQYASELSNPPCVNFCGLAAYDEMPKLMRQADALLVPVTFDPELLLFSQLSMPTKVPEHMISGTPVILHGPSTAAPIAYGIRDNWGYVIDQPDKAVLKDKIVALMDSVELREQAGKPAQILAREHHDLAAVREKFWELIKDVANR